MSTKSSSFLSGRRIGDCRPNADIVVYYDGVSDDQPVIEAGTLAFKGGKANVPNQGIGVSGFGAGGFRIIYDDIRPGGAGVKLRCATTDTKQRIRFTVLKPVMCQGYMTNIVSLQLQAINTCEGGYEFEDELPLHLFKRCSTLETDCQITEEIARQFNRDYAHLGKAYTTIETIGGVTNYAVDIETLKEGQTFLILQHEGLSNPRVIIPGNKRTYTRSLVQDWFGTSIGPVIYNGANDASLNVVEIYGTIDVRTTFNGVATSDMTTGDTTTTTKVPITVSVLFEIGAKGDAAFAKLKALLKGPGNNNGAGVYLAKMIDDTCADQLFYPYTIVRTDAGDAAAMAAVKTDYPDIKTIYLAGYIAGKSYYEVYTASDQVPAPTVAKPGDVVSKGANQVPAFYTVSACPAGTACADCAPSAPAPL